MAFAAVSKTLLYKRKPLNLLQGLQKKQNVSPISSTLMVKYSWKNFFKRESLWETNKIRTLILCIIW